VVKAHLPTKPTEVVYQGVDPSEYSGRYDDIGLKRPAVVVIQNHAILPKVEGLLSFRRVIQKLPAVNFYIAEGEDFGQSYLPLIKESFSRCNNVHFVKGINNPTAVRNMLGSADAYVLASGLDCCPTTILEASLMRRAVIASRVGGIPEIVLQNETGWTIGNESINEWVSKLSMILEDAKLRKRIGERGREWVTEKFGWRTIGTQVEHLLTREAATRP
jgi:glycosyltransferase involved in cell wall biosynthesis